MPGTKKRMDHQLPPTPCTQEMRESLIHLAERQGRSIADLQREAIALFLSKFDSNAIRNESVLIAEQEPA